jgi:hypothetical protein
MDQGKIQQKHLNQLMNNFDQLGLSDLASEQEQMNLHFSKFDIAMQCYQNEQGILDRIEQNASFKNSMPVRDITGSMSTRRIQNERSLVSMRNNFL